jgi:hypothetical protein
MRTLRSFGATRRRTPLFFGFSPSFQVRKSWFAYVSTSLSSSEAIVATTSWIPDLFSRSVSFVSSALRVAAGRMFA